MNKVFTKKIHILFNDFKSLNFGWVTFFFGILFGTTSSIKKLLTHCFYIHFSLFLGYQHIENLC